MRLFEGDCLDILPTLPDASVDACVCDPPYGLSRPPDMAEVLRHWLAGDDYTHRGSGFMGKAWDSFVPGPSVWREVFRVLKPGGHLLAFGGSRTVDLLGVAIRLAGFEVRDQLQWLYGTGFPKSLDVSKALDKAAGAKRKVVGKGINYDAKARHGGTWTGAVYGSEPASSTGPLITAPATPEAEQWAGWGTALKPGHEPIVMARKPIVGTVASNVLAHGTGAINVDGCRIDGGERPLTAGRWPANVMLDEEAAAMLDAQSGALSARGNKNPSKRVCRPDQVYAMDIRDGDCGGRLTYDKGGGASRFFYCAKASKRERDAGLTGPETSRFSGGHGGASILLKGSPMPTGRNNHPTVKPLALMRWLVRLVTPPGGVVLDPFAGSGSTGLAAQAEGFDAILIERDPGHAALARARVGQVKSEP